MSNAELRYRTLLDASSAFAGQPTVTGLLHSLRGLLSNISALHGTELCLLNEDGKTMHVFARDHDADAPAITVGTTIMRIGAAAQVLEEQRPVFVPDVSHEMVRHADLAPFAAEVAGRPGYLLPLSTSRKQYGILVVTKLAGQEFAPEDVELMHSMAAHVAVALEAALARDTAEAFERQAARECERLDLLLEINNQIVTVLDTDALLRAASESIRKHFENEFTSFMLFEEQPGRLAVAMLDFPGTRGYLGRSSFVQLSEGDVERLRRRKPEIVSTDDRIIAPENTELLKAEGIASVVIVPLAGSKGLIGAMCLGTRNENRFAHGDLDLLSQVGNQISLALENALAYGRLAESREHLEDQRVYLESEIVSEFNFEDIVGNSTAIQHVLKQVAIVAPTSSTVLLHGETGTGKELVARAIHRGSPRRDRTFVKLNCAAIPSGLLESELFGHEKGAFTGALMQKKGRFEVADHGTLFMDEIGDISLELQPKLLRALQEREFERLGSSRTIQVDVRIIAATHRDMAAMIRNNQFREDLFYRLNVFPIEIPPLRERPGDIPLLVHYFVSRLARRMQKNIRTIPKHAMQALASAPWPGNVRELENFIERAVILTQGTELNVPIAQLKNAVQSPRASSVSTFHDAERQAILEALKASEGKLAGAGGAAARLGLKRTTLQGKMRRLQILKSEYLQQAN